MAAARPPPPPGSKPPPAPLGRLLNGLERAHKADVQELTTGHLNESRLYRHPEPPRRNRLLEHGRAEAAGGATAAEFASEPRVPVRRVRLPAAPSAATSAAPSGKPQQQQPLPPSSPGKPELHREALVEELLLPAPQQQPQRLLAPAGDGSHAGNYRRAQLIRRRLVREQDVAEQDLMTGYAAVRDLEMRLQENLRQHFGNSSGPSFHRLQMYSAALDEIIQQSATFGCVLERIKASYDDYLAWLLDGTAPAQHRHLRTQLEQLRDPRAESELRQLRDYLGELETAAEAALAGLADSRRQLAEAEASAAAEDQAAEAAAVPQPANEEATKTEDETSASRCERLLREIWSSLDAASELRRELRERRSPLVCAAHLERCCRVAQAEMQAVEEELARVRAANQAAAEDLLVALTDADGDAADGQDEEAGAAAADSGDRRRVIRLIGPECAAAALANEALDLEPGLLLGEEAVEDSRKWDWYIG